MANQPPPPNQEWFNGPARAFMQTMPQQPGPPGQQLGPQGPQPNGHLHHPGHPPPPLPPPIQILGQAAPPEMYGLVHHESVGPEARRLWDVFLTGRYDTIDEYLLALNRYGRAAGYAFVKRRSTRYRDGQATRYVLACDKANKRPSQATIRNRTTDKTNCPFTVQGVYLGNKWRVEEIPGAMHNHPPAEDPHKLRSHKRRARLQKNGVIEASPEPEVQEIAPPPEPPVEGIRIVLELRPTPDRFLQVDAFMDEIPSKQAQIIGKSIRLPIPSDEMGNIDISILRRSRLINTPIQHIPPVPIQQSQPLQPSQPAPEAHAAPQPAPQPPQPAQPTQPAQASEPIEIDESSDSEEEEGEEALPS